MSPPRTKKSAARAACFQPNSRFPHKGKFLKKPIIHQASKSSLSYPAQETQPPWEISPGESAAAVSSFGNVQKAFQNISTPNKINSAFLHLHMPSHVSFHQNTCRQFITIAHSFQDGNCPPQFLGGTFSYFPMPKLPGRFGAAAAPKISARTEFSGPSSQSRILRAEFSGQSSHSSSSNGLFLTLFPSPPHLSLI